MQATIALKFICNFRQSNVLRFGVAPLCLSYVSIWVAAQALREILETEEWRQDQFQEQNLAT